MSTADPWNFSNDDPKFISPSKQFRVEYGTLYEIAMGAPVGGEFFLINLSAQKKTSLHKFCGGPAVWNETSQCIAVPEWTADRMQKILLFDLEKRTMTRYAETFRVLHLYSIHENILTGIDSPIHATEKLNFDLSSEPIEKIVALKKL